MKAHASKVREHPIVAKYFNINNRNFWF